jgi:hypothetical protein
MSGNYPSDDELKLVRDWQFQEPGSFEVFMAFVKSIGNYWSDESVEVFGWEQKGRTYYVSTGGWSGNEDILSAMRANQLFWLICWQEHRRGGHYVFELPDPKTEQALTEGDRDGGNR